MDTKSSSCNIREFTSAMPCSATQQLWHSSVLSLAGMGVDGLACASRSRVRVRA